MIRHVLRFTTCLLLMGRVFAEDEPWSPPDEILFKGTSYRLAYSVPQRLYEYTTHDETVENWTSLFSIIFSKRQNGPLAVIAADLASALNARTPKPRYILYKQGDYLVSRIVYDFTGASTVPHFESNARKLFYSDSCRGFFDISIGYRVPKSAKPVEEILVENEAFTNDLLAHSLKPACVVP